MSDDALGYLRDKFPLSGEVIAELRRKRWRRLTMAQKLLPEMRVANCYRRLAAGASSVEIRYSGAERRAYYHGLVTCGSVWSCPVCSAKITEIRRQELTQAISTWRSRGGSLLMVTVTLQHQRDDELKALLIALKDSWRRLKSGRWWLSMRERYGLEHYVSSTEVTYGGHGWHPHIHALFFSSLAGGELDIDTLQAELTARYTALLAEHGKYASEYYGIDVRLGDKYAGEYASKYGLEHELTKSISKNGSNGGCSPFELLDKCRDGDKQAGALFVEYAHTFFGARQLSWSHGARAALGLAQEQDDAAIAAAEPESEPVVLATLTPREYTAICLAELRGEVLEIASTGDAAYLWSFLAVQVGLKIPEYAFT